MKPEELHNIYAAEGDFWWYQGMRAIVRAVMQSAPLRGGIGLDAGCGTGFNAMEMEKSCGTRMFGVDLAPLALRYAQERKFRRGTVASVTSLPFRDGSFDLITSFDVLSHLPRGDESKALQEFARVLRPDGWLVLRVPAFDALRSRHSEFINEHQRFRAGRLCGLLERQGLTPVKWTYANSFLSPVALLKFRVIEPLQRAAPHSGVDQAPPAWLNGLLAGVLQMEAAMIRGGVRFLFGQSLLVVARKMAAPKTKRATDPAQQ